MNFIRALFWIFSLVILLQQCVGSFFCFLLSKVDGDLPSLLIAVLWRSLLFLTSETSVIKLVFWVAPVWFLKVSLEHQRNLRKNFLSDYLVKVNVAKCHKLSYINKIMLLFEYEKGGLTLETPPPPRMCHCPDSRDVLIPKALNFCTPLFVFFPHYAFFSK